MRYADCHGRVRPGHGQRDRGAPALTFTHTEYIEPHRPTGAGGKAEDPSRFSPWLREVAACGSPRV